MSQGRAPDPFVCAADWLVAAMLVASAIAEPPGWYRAISALILLALATYFPRIGDLGRAAAAAALAPVASLFWATMFTLMAFVGAKIAASRTAGGGLTPNNSLATILVVGIATAVAVKQGVASTVLARAEEGVFVASTAGIALVGALVWGGRGRPHGADVLPLVFAAGFVLANTTRLLVSPPQSFARVEGVITLSAANLPLAARIRAADRVDALAILYPRLVAEAKSSPELLAYLVRLSPTRDEAAMLLPVDDALAAGWRPRRAEGRTVEVAQALWQRGQGGEATRLLRRYPRFGEIDATLALFERREGGVSGWRGGVMGTVLPGQAVFGRQGRLWATGSREFVVTAAAPLTRLALQFSGQNYQGAPLIDVQLDREKPLRVEVAESLWIDLGPVEAGVHYVQITFLNDNFGPTGDRNVALSRIEGVE